MPGQGAAPSPVAAIKKLRPTSELKYGMWYITHRVFLYRLAIGSLIGVCGLLVLFNIWKWAVYLIEIPQSSAVRASLATGINYAAANAHFTAQPLVVDKTLLVPSGTNVYDALSELINPNARFVAEFDYAFLVGGTTTPMQHATLLPGDSGLFRYSPLTSVAGSPSIIFNNIVWKRLSAHDFADVQEYQKNRLRFTVSDFVFTPASQEGPGGSSISFKIKNESAFSYAEPHFMVGLYNGDVLVGALPWQADTFKSQEEKNVDLRSFVPLLQVTSIQLFPSVNIYSSSVYLQPGV